MGQVRLLLSIASLAVLSGCADRNYVGPGAGPNTPSLLSRHSVTGNIASTETSLANSTSSALPADKLIALTFDDGPRPYVLFGTQGVHPAPGLIDILDKNGVKATFFVVGWRRTPKTLREPRHEATLTVTSIHPAHLFTRRSHD